MDKLKNLSMLILKISVCLIVLFNYAVGQNNYIDYHLKVYEARKLNFYKSYNEAASKYLEAFSLVDYVHVLNLIDAEEVAVKSKSDTLNKIISMEYGKYNKSINEHYKAAIDTMFERDQNVRSNDYVKASLFYYKCLKDSTYDASNDEHNDAKFKVRQMNEVDSVNISKLLNLIELYGFPSEKNVGKDSYEQAFIILLHFDFDKDNLLLKPILDKALMKGEIMPEDYAWIVDRRVTWGKGEKAYYYFMPMGAEDLTDVEIEIVNERRKKIGLRALFEGTEIIRNKNKTTVKKIF